MNTALSQRLRLLAAGVYLLLLGFLYHRILELPDSQNHALFWFYSGALMIVLGKYVVEPFFTTPADAIVNALALLIALSSLSKADQFSLLGYTALNYYGVLVIVLAVAAIAFKDGTSSFSNTAAKLTYKAAEFT